MSIEKRLEKRKKVLNMQVKNNGVMSKHTIRISEQVDILVIRKMSKTFSL